MEKKRRHTRQQRRHGTRKTVRGGASPGTRIRLIYGPGGASTGIEKYIEVEDNAAAPGWGTALKNLESSWANFIQGMIMTPETRAEKIKKTSTYIVNALEKPEVVDIQEKREHNLCEDEKTADDKKKNPTAEE